MTNIVFRNRFFFTCPLLFFFT